jgi:hypothetical protein
LLRLPDWCNGSTSGLCGVDVVISSNVEPSETACPATSG